VNKNVKIGIGLAVLAIAGYLAWRWWQARQAATPGGGQLGTNLNSIAPELVGGSSGPVAQPAFDVPVNITVSSESPPPQSPDADDTMIPANPVGTYGGSFNALTAQPDAAAASIGTVPSMANAGSDDGQ
jgi:hypothetical protein